ncbi:MULTISPECIES: YidH family protein [Bacillaceae]|uniref:YidH family protein n=1 Tax=Bacillaceae TaxID=186817 RepID=UPI000B9BB0F9|nr:MULTISPECIES: DUF202 domain-containing protein [Bacillus]OXT17525.1 hypothetical protein B9K06_09420 [Bacillus sp. OG2]MCA1037288.1 DUF202 domain-containing protein [Bacillus infantis]MCK6207414.1 DUF202 domain-containing protein [Bacillus infantis]MCP1156686.1 DUF202 domain-containing protein [Bacillus infantis]MDW2878689.1 DUF202 domain-containing protein [Bacillus infantis]
MDNGQPTKDSKYIQQHLANERTYLAWVRTSITIIGVGFLITNLHFSTLPAASMIGDALAQIIGLASIIVGILTIIMTTIGYFRKGHEINSQSFRFSRRMIVLLSALLLLIFAVFGFYYMFVWGIL